MKLEMEETSGGLIDEAQKIASGIEGVQTARAVGQVELLAAAHYIVGVAGDDRP